MMLTTYNQSQLGMSVYDSTVQVAPGAVRVGNTIMDFRGSQITFPQMVSFASASGKYKSCTLFLQDTNAVADLTSVSSVAVSSIAELTPPQLPGDSSSVYSMTRSVGSFVFYSADGSNIQLISHEKSV